MNPSEQPQRRGKLSPRAKDVLWHGGKAVLCLVQFYATSMLAYQSVSSLAYSAVQDMFNWYYLSIILAAQLIIFYGLWRYYDNNDDRSFDRFCACEKTPDVLHDAAYRLNLVLSSVGGTVVFLLFSVYPFLRTYLPMISPFAAVVLAVPISGTIAFGMSVSRLRRLNHVWSVQKTLRRRTDKRMSAVKRIIYTIIFGVALMMVTVVGTSLLPGFLRLLVQILLLSKALFALVFCVAAFLILFRLVRRLSDRRKFMKRLNRLQDTRELSFNIHGHPYLSLFSRRAPFSLTITDRPHPDAKVQTPSTYQVAVANCNRRRMVVILCEGNVFQFMYAFKLRVIGRPGTLAMGAKMLNIPLGAFFISHSFAFPSGEGKRILLVDPAPHNLCMRGFHEGELIALDNASDLYGYTVYGKNSFINVLERT